MLSSLANYEQKRAPLRVASVQNRSESALRLGPAAKTRRLKGRR
jgi:hypothetical protein